MKTNIIWGVIFSLTSSVAMAHSGHAMHSAIDGFMHPLMGLDHVLVMLAVGILACKMGGKAMWQLPLTFMGAMLGGVLLAWGGISLPGTETMIALSVFAVGLLIAFVLPMNRVLNHAVVGGFALFHGLSHGVELSHQQGVSVIAAMLLATGLLHGLGLLLGSQGWFVSKLRLGVALGMMSTSLYLLVH